MKFVAFLRDFENTDSRLRQMKWAEEMGGEDAAWNLPEGVKILESGGPIGGPYDLVIFYEAPDAETAHRFMGEIWPYAKVERYLTVPCHLCENAKKMQ